MQYELNFSISWNYKQQNTPANIAVLLDHWVLSQQSTVGYWVLDQTFTLQEKDELYRNQLQSYPG